MQIHLNTALHSEQNKAYYGGRVEVFDSGIGENTVYHFDVPGLYAGIMQNALPVGNPVYLSKFDKDTELFHKYVLGLESQGKIAFFKCEVKTPMGINIPVLPIKINGKLTFPLGEFAGT